jgi:hypothetical protein
MSVWDNNDKREVNQQDFDNLKAIGATLVVIETQGSMSVEPPYGPNIYYQEGEYIVLHIEMLDRMVEFARNADLQYVIAIRDGPGRIDVSQPGESTIWTNKAEQQLYGKMLKEMASRYLPDTLFVGMVMVVEPNPLGELWEPPIPVLDSALKANSIDIDIIQSIWIDSIRTIDSDLPLIVGSNHASHPEYFSLVKKQTDNNIIYTTHLYNPGEYSHAETPFSKTYPDVYWCARLENVINLNKTTLKNEIYKPVLDFQATYNVPILVGEFGIRVPQNGGEQYLKDIASIACESGWHYAIWGFNNGPEFNYKDLDSIYGTNYWDIVKSLMNCSSTSVNNDSKKEYKANFSPNPFSESITINYKVSFPGIVKIHIYNSLGEKITTLIDEWQDAGSHRATFEAGNLPQGMYYYTIRIGERIESGKMMLIR